ncbi:MAG: SPOR domain-containing protein [Ignavibacteriales bacterium]|nr:MAG: SPOR domain-containing protein [Ignavibacteriales bacterium]
MKRLLVLFIFILFVPAFAQDVDIIPYLKQIEAGNTQNASEELPLLKKKNPDSPSVLFLEGVLTENGQDALVIYNSILTKYPRSKYADAAMFRVYSYYYALGLYETAANYLKRLKNEYPESPYIKIADRTIPQQDDMNELSRSEVKETPKETTPPVKDTKKYLYTLQAGAFSSYDNASELKKSFELSGYYSEIKEKTVGGSTFHVVYVGRFVKEDEARSTMQVINSEFKINAIVTSIN